ncbi:MAG: DEAD/DEAH box helicase, partial [Thiohalocapsa sp.]
MTSSLITLRDYQQDAIGAVRTQYAQGAVAPLLVAPTGSGKTWMFVYIAQSAAARGRRALILVHRGELLMQTSRTLESLRVRHGLVAPGQSWTEAMVQVASVQTLVRRLGRLGEQSRSGAPWVPDLIVVDEAHHATPKSGWGKVLRHWPDARVLGVTATPERLDGQGLGAEVGGFFDALVLGPTVRELVARGFLSQPVVFAPSVVDVEGVKTKGGDFDRAGAAQRVDRPTITGDAEVHYRKHLNGAPALAFCTTVAHAEHVAEGFRLAGWRAASLDGKLPERERRQRIADLANGELQLLASCEIVSEGTDIPVVAGAVLLRHTQSLGLYLQQVGRTLRPFPGKERAVILDHVGNVYRHGLPDEDRDWALDQEKRSKRKKKRKEVGERRVKCLRCNAMHLPGPACPNCGFAYPEQRLIAFREGELQEVDPGQVRARMPALRKR